ncbi:hypothetical protein U1Q18_049882 [Sarracenia purpurea var. burkii]
MRLRLRLLVKCNLDRCSPYSRPRRGGSFRITYVHDGEFELADYGNQARVCVCVGLAPCASGRHEYGPTTTSVYLAYAYAYVKFSQPVFSGRRFSSERRTGQICEQLSTLRSEDRTAEWYGRIDGNDYDNGQHGDDVRPSRVIVVFRVVLGLMCTREPLQMRVRLQVLVLVLVRVSMLEILRA